MNCVDVNNRPDIQRWEKWTAVSLSLMMTEKSFQVRKVIFFCLVFRAASTVCWSFRANEALMRSLGASVPVCLISHHVLNSTITKKESVEWVE